MNKSINLYKDIFTGLSFTVGVFGFMSGEFILYKSIHPPLVNPNLTEIIMLESF